MYMALFQSVFTIFVCLLITCPCHGVWKIPTFGLADLTSDAVVFIHNEYNNSDNSYCLT